MRIFFYCEGIYNALMTEQTTADQYDIISGWSSLAAQHQVDLLVCISAAQLRGLTVAKGSESPQLADGFRIGGLGEMAEAMIEADRIMVF